MNSYFVCSLFLLMLSSYLWFLEGETIGSHRHTTGFIPQLPTNDECTKSLARAVYIINLLFIGYILFSEGLFCFTYYKKTAANQVLFSCKPVQLLQTTVSTFLKMHLFSKILVCFIDFILKCCI